MTLELAADAAAPPVTGPDVPRLRVESDGQRQDVPLGAYPLTIGREADNAVVLRDPHVSRHHARITWENGDYWVEDLKSQNGTLLNGDTPVDRRRLESGDQLAIGSATLTYLPQAAAQVHVQDGTPMNETARLAQALNV
jgi:pSer/pThr/pTyr-binding forkhead associated (FHA) protein